MSRLQSHAFGLRSLCSIFSVVLLTSGPVAALADSLSTESWDISADKVMRFDDPSSIVAQGNVVLEKKEKLPPPRKRKASVSSWDELLGETGVPEEKSAEEEIAAAEPRYRTTVTISADWMVYDVELQSIKAKGNVRIETPEEVLTASSGTVDLTNETGKFDDATILRDEHSVHLEGKSVEKTGYDTYRIVDGWVITCKLQEGETPPWSLAAATTEVKQGGYAVLRHAKFKVKDIPIFYTPYMVVPVKNTRQTGLLFPEFSTSSNNGFGFNLPLFVNISDSTDMTLFPEYYYKRGFMPGAEFRYVTSPTNQGMLSATYLHDQLSDPSETEYWDDTGYTHDNQDRYWVRGKANHTFAGEWQTRADLDIVSDQDYLREFDGGLTGFKQSNKNYLETFGRGFQNDTATQRKNSLKTLRSWRGMSLEASLLAINDADTEASDTDTPLWKMPEVAFNGALPLWESGLTFDWDANYVNYWREDGVGGHRVDLRPSLSTPIPLSQYLESRAEVAVRDTYYAVETYGDAEWANDDSQNRLLFEFETEVATTLEKDFYGDDSGNRTSSHQIRPFVQYDYIPDVDQDELPQFDNIDTIDPTNGFTYGLDNFYNLFSSSPNNYESFREYAYLKVEQTYELDPVESDEPFSAIRAKMGWSPFSGTRVLYKTAYNVYDSDFDAHTFEGIYRNSRGDFFFLDYSFKESLNIEQINSGIRARVLNHWLAGAEVEHSLSQDETVKATASLTYLALCWSVKFETRYTPNDTAFVVLFNLANIGVPLGVRF